ncbi:MAG: hypothetical protein ACRCYV_03975 [Aeromonas sp.]
MNNAPSTVMVLFNLKSDTCEADYLAWAKSVDLPTVNGLRSVNAFSVYKGLNPLGQATPSPWDYFEVIEISSSEAFLRDIQSAAMQQVIAQFQAFTQDAHFICTQNILTA